MAAAIRHLTTLAIKHRRPYPTPTWCPNRSGSTSLSRLRAPEVGNKGYWRVGGPFAQSLDHEEHPTMNTRAKIAACSALAAMLLGPATVPAAGVVTLASGAMVAAKMNQTIDSGSAQQGQKFTMTVVAPYPQGNTEFAGAALSGHVTRVVA